MLEDDEPAIEHLMNIIHFNTGQIPDPMNLSIFQIYQIAAAVDKYDLHGCLGLYPDKWCQGLLEKFNVTTSMRSMLHLVTSVRSMVHLAWIGWVFGRLDSFEFALTRIMIMIELQDDGDGNATLVDELGKPLKDMKCTQAMDIVNHLAASRHNIMTGFVRSTGDIVQKALSNMILPSFCRYSALTSPDPEAALNTAINDCDTALRGLLITALTRQGLFPYPTVFGPMLMSIDDLHVRLTRVVNHVLMLQEARAEFHAICGPKDHITRILCAMSNLRFKPTPEHRRQLELAKNKCQGIMMG